MERKDLSLAFAVLKADEATGIVEGIANVGNIKDLQGDNMLPGCWGRVIREGQQPAFCWGHQVNPPDIRGKVVGLMELPPGDPRIPQNQKGPAKASGLWFKAQMAMETQAGRDTHALLKGGYIKELSVHFTNEPDGEESDGKGGRNVKEVAELFEISAVLKGASVGTRVLVAKDDTPGSGEAEPNVTDKNIALITRSNSTKEKPMPEPEEENVVSTPSTQQAAAKLGISEQELIAKLVEDGVDKALKRQDARRTDITTRPSMAQSKEVPDLGDAKAWTITEDDSKAFNDNKAFLPAGCTHKMGSGYKEAMFDDVDRKFYKSLDRDALEIGRAHV